MFCFWIAPVQNQNNNLRLGLGGIDITPNGSLISMRRSSSGTGHPIQMTPSGNYLT